MCELTVAGSHLGSERAAAAANTGLFFNNNSNVCGLGREAGDTVGYTNTVLAIINL